MKAQIIEKEGQFYKECGIVMLETIKSSPILLNNGILSFDYGTKPNRRELGFIRQHLYITSDDGIKEGDWYLANDCNHINDKPIYVVRKCDNITNGWLESNSNIGQGDNPDWSKKIIATTDTSLTIPYDGTTSISKNWSGKQLPQPSEKFIQAFIETFNRGEKIEKVLVEYDRYFEGSSLGGAIIEYKYNLKLKDNNIIIKKIKTEYTREDMIHALTYGCREGKLGRTHSDILIEYKQNHL